MMRLVLSNPRKQLNNGFEKCRQMRPKVSLNGAVGNYKVKGNDNLYNVHLWRDERGNKLAECQCKANENGMFCYHIAAAFLAHVGIMRQRQAA
jgi:hypothetical protein